MNRRGFLGLTTLALGSLATGALADGRRGTPWLLHKVTWYCPCDRCCGTWDAQGRLVRPASGLTAKGHPPIEGNTVAVDPRVWAYGTLLEIEGVGVRLASDTGSAIKGHELDVYVDDHHRAVRHGVRHLRVRPFVQGSQKVLARR